MWTSINSILVRKQNKKKKKNGRVRSCHERKKQNYQRNDPRTAIGIKVQFRLIWKGIGGKSSVLDSGDKRFKVIFSRRGRGATWPEALDRPLPRLSSYLPSRLNNSPRRFLGPEAEPTYVPSPPWLPNAFSRGPARTRCSRAEPISRPLEIGRGR